MTTERDPNGLDAHAPGAKLDAGKSLSGILQDFSRALAAIAEVGTYGANKYSRGGWQHVPNGQERYNDAMWRHLLKEQQEPLDPDTGLPHIYHRAWNVLAELELMLRNEPQQNLTLQEPVKVHKKRQYYHHCLICSIGFATPEQTGLCPDCGAKSFSTHVIVE